MSRSSAKTTNPLALAYPQLHYYRSFSKSSYALRTQEWFNLTRDDVLRLCRTPPVISFLVGWLTRMQTPSCDWWYNMPEWKNQFVVGKGVAKGRTKIELHCALRHLWSYWAFLTSLYCSECLPKLAKIHLWDLFYETLCLYCVNIRSHE
jgi:hypothetical protein